MDDLDEGITEIGGRRMTTARSTRVLFTAALALGAALAPGSIAAADDAIGAEQVAGGLDVPVGFTFDPRGRIWYVEKLSGEVRILNLRRDTDRLFRRISGVNAEGERGTLGIALHPQYPARPFVYVFATRSVGDGPLQNQIVRLRDVGGRGRRPNVIFRSPTTAQTNHNGGRILFGPDGMLYAVVGDGGAMPSTAQDLRDVRGKVLRMTPLGAAPADNPLRRRLFAYGIRNSFGFDFDPLTGNLWETENGPQCNDELNLILPGGNYGWGPSQTCSGPSPENTNRDGPNPVLPLAWFTPPIAPTGIAFCDDCRLAADDEGTFFFGTNNTREIRQVTLDAERDDIVTVATVHSAADRIISLEAAPGGRIYFSGIGGGIFRLTLAAGRGA
jgi:glucose/arabinose dehydrogenase